MEDFGIWGMIVLIVLVLIGIGYAGAELARPRIYNNGFEQGRCFGYAMALESDVYHVDQDGNACFVEVKNDVIMIEFEDLWQ